MDEPPDRVDDPVFGPLRYDGTLDWWIGTVEFTPGGRVDVFIDHDPDVDPADEVAAAARRFAHFRTHEPEHRRQSAGRLVETRWNADEPMTADDVAGLLRVASLTFLSDGRMQVYWDDGDRLFYGHNVVTDLSPEGEFVGTRME